MLGCVPAVPPPPPPLAGAVGVLDRLFLGAGASLELDASDDGAPVVVLCCVLLLATVEPEVTTVPATEMPPAVAGPSS